MASIRLERLEKNYGGQVAVAELDLDIVSGEFVVLVGPSGCGKTTTLRMIAGFARPSNGRILIGDKVVNDLPPRARGIGMVFQDYALFPNMTVRQNIAFGLEEHGAPRAQVEKRVGEMLELIRMGGFAARFPSELSGGQQQRVALARALAYEPRVLLMDEPLGALDQKLREEMQREFASIQRRLAITTVFVTHDQQEAMALADRIVVMHAGRAEQVGSPDAVYREPATHFTATFIGRSNEFAGTVVAVDDGLTRLRLGSGRIVSAKAAADLGAGEPARCIVRPEKLRLAARPMSDDRRHSIIEVVVRRRAYLGSIVDLICESADSREVIVQLSPGQDRDVVGGEVIYLEFAAEEAFCFPGPPPAALR